MKGYYLKVPEPTLELWKKAAAARGTSVSLMIREAVNREIGAGTRPLPASQAPIWDSDSEE